MATVRVDVPPGTKPHFEHPRRMPKHKHDAVTSQIKEWLDDGVIERCPMASPWNMGLVVVAKTTDPGAPLKYRVCIDPRPVNAVTPNDPHPLPYILDYLDDACGAEVFSSLDLKGSFHQFLVFPGHQDILSFTWQSIQYRFKRGPFGLKALAGQFQRVMYAILGDLPYVRVYIDDIIIFSNSVSEHVAHVSVVLKRLNLHNLRIQPPKCKFFRPAVPYLGHIVSGAGIRISNARVAEITAVPRPTTRTQVQSFLGMVNFLRSFIPCLATMAAPLDALRNLRSWSLDDKSVWTDQCEDAFECIKDALRSAPVLGKPDWSAEFLVATDASAVGLGVVLFQGSRDDPRYIVCVSRALTPSERNYSATKRELLGIIFALRKLRFYLAGRRFRLFTDHKALTYMFEQKRLNDMLERWLDELLEFDFTVIHIPGVLNVLPDCLSRLYGIESSRDFHAKAALVASVAPQPDGDAACTGLPCPPWGDFHIAHQRDWLPQLPCALRGGRVPDGDMDTDLYWDVYEEPGSTVMLTGLWHRSVLAAPVLTQGQHMPAVAGTPGPIVDAVPADSHLPIALSQLGENVEVTPPDQREAALDWAHSQGHKGCRGTMHRLLTEGHKWPGMEKDCLRVAQRCVDCQRFTAQKYGFHPLRAVTADLPMDHLAVDLAQLKTSSCGKSYILVVLDICTRFAWLYSLPDKSGVTVAAALKSLFATFGKPLYIQSDNGSEFRNLDFQQLMAAVGVDHRKVLPYYPQANGAAERVIRSIKENLNATIRGDTSAWPQHLPVVQYAYNTTVHRRHGSTPFSLFFARGHNPWRGEPKHPPRGRLTHHQLLARNRFMTDVVFPAIGDKTQAYAQSVFEGFARRHKIIKDDFPGGALVMRQVKPRQSKMLPSWEGPYMVVRRSRSGGYILKDTLNEELVQKVPASQLRLVSYEGGLSPDSFEVDHIVSHRGSPGSREYLIRWKGFSAGDDSWVTEKDINSLGCVSEYWDKERSRSSTVRSGGRAVKRHADPTISPLTDTLSTPAPARRRCRTTR
ncbi:MAG: hypothetical protein AN485_18965 [Anabaena sp. MDT14b]|nr:MAG: hypothetical protein AN485_18965 [Anabaena sp. MDT14b]